jgi:hypothetical protein
MIKLNDKLDSFAIPGLENDHIGGGLLLEMSREL